MIWANGGVQLFTIHMIWDGFINIYRYGHGSTRTQFVELGLNILPQEYRVEHLSRGCASPRLHRIAVRRGIGKAPDAYGGMWQRVTCL